MKTNFTRVLSLLLATLMLLSVMSVGTFNLNAISYSGSASYMAGKYYTQLCNVTLTGHNATDIVNVAKSQIGYKSGSSNNDLSGSTTSTSNVKYSEYGRVIGSNPNDWCAYFVSWCARQAGISTSVLPNFAGCTPAYNSTLPNAGCAMYRKSSGYIPKAGDIIFFGNSSSYIYHVGIVTSATSTTVYYIDGNNTSTTPHCVANSSKALTNGSIWGYAVPAYNNTVHKINSSYNTNFTAYPKSKITAENIFDANHNQISSTAWIGTSDKCTIHEVYTDGCCKVSYPLDSGGTKTVYSKISLFNTHTHNYTGQRVYETAHPHEISQRCVDYATCGGYRWTGENAQVKTCSKCWNGSFTVSPSSVNVEVGKNQTVNISLSGCFPDSAVLDVKYDESIVSVTSSGQTFTFKGVKKGNCSYMISVYSDSSKKTRICTKTIPVTVSTHTHTYVGPSYEKAHPHKKYMSCSAGDCDAFYYTGENAATYAEPFYEAIHPHRYYRECTVSGCDEYEYTGEYAQRKTCSKCWNGSFTVSQSSVSVEVGKTQTVNISLSGYFPDSAVCYSDHDNSIVSVTSSGQTYTFKGLKKGSCNFVITVYSDSSKKTVICSKTIPVTVEAASVTKIAANTPNKTNYYVGDSLDTTGLKLTVTYSDGTVKTVTSGFTTSGFSSSTAGTKTVTVSYGGKSTTFTVKVTTPTISINTSGKTLKISESVTVDATTTPTGQTVTWKSGNTGVATVSNGKVTAVGEGDVSIYASFTYNGIKYETKIPVTVTKPTVTLNSISVKSLPDKTNYYIGDKLDTTGLAITAKYSDGSTRTITNGFSVSGFDSSSKGTKTVAVSYDGKTTSFETTVKSPAVVIALDSKSLTVGDVYTLSATAEPNNVDLMWSSYDANIATVSNGKISVKTEGEVIIKAKFTYNGITYSDTCTIKITDTGCKHKYTTVYDAVTSTCTTQGRESYTVCDDCKTIISGSNKLLPLLDHTPGEYVVTREPTYNIVGIEACFCTECGKQLDRRQIPVLEYENKFTDVKPSHWFWESVNYVARKGFMSGMSETKFSPNTELTREQFIQILFAMEGKEKSDYNGATGFSDVPEGKWYSPAIKWAKQERITDGVGNGKFGLGANVTREQMAKFMMSFAEYKNYNTVARSDISFYKDANKVSSWSKEAMQWCVSMGIYESTSTTEKQLEPRISVKRSVAATVIMKFVQAMRK